jgi:cytoskeletal protein CcmA (bactofilin family)
MNFRKLIKDKGTTFSGVIPADVAITGDIVFQSQIDPLRIEGSIVGKIASAFETEGVSQPWHNGVYIAKGGKVTGNITLKSVIIDGGLVEGNITALQVVLKGNAVVKGDITYDELSIEAGSSVTGQMTPNAPSF